jgi:hypothetical protein
MEYIIAKLLLPIMLPIILAAVKVAIDKAAPGLYAKIPKQFWLAAIPVLAESANTISPDLFLFPGLPSWASTFLYTVGSAGAREVMTQIVKLVNGDMAPAQTVFGPPSASPTGM